MKKIFGLVLLLAITLASCSSDNETETKNVNITLKFTHNWDGVPVTSSDFNNFKFTTENGESVSIEKLRYLVSSITFANNSISQVSSNAYFLVDVKEENTTLEFKNYPLLRVNSLFFVFGFRDNDNIDGVYQDLNSANFNVPGMLGGGYHYMQFDGKYKDTNNADANFNYHAIRAVDRTDPNNLVFQDTSFEVDLGNIEITNNATIEIKMNIAEWFRNPNTWDLNQLNTVLMPNFEAQKLMSENGKSVFSLGEINQ